VFFRFQHKGQPTKAEEEDARLASQLLKKDACEP
jgi:hypothetical protein